MLYQNFSNNLLYVLREARELSFGQIVRFFEQENNIGMIKYIVRVLISHNRIDYKPVDPSKDPSLETEEEQYRAKLVYHGKNATPELNDYEKSKRIKAFWVIADVGSENVNQIFSLSNGNQFFFTSGDQCYELTVVDTEYDAMVSLKDRDLHLERNVKSYQDQVVRIAIVPDEETAGKIEDYGFDAYCILDEDKRPDYGSWNASDEEDESSVDEKTTQEEEENE